jgi:hypothetical protein
VPCRSYLFGSSVRGLVCSSSHELILGMSLRIFNAMVSPCLLHDCIDTRWDSFGSARRKGLYLQRTTQHRNKKTNVHAPSLIRTHDPSNQAVKTDALGCAATGTGSTYIRENIFRPVANLFAAILHAACFSQIFINHYSGWRQCFPISVICAVMLVLLIVRATCHSAYNAVIELIM